MLFIAQRVLHIALVVYIQDLQTHYLGIGSYYTSCHVADQFVINQRTAKCKQHKDKLSEAIFMKRKFKQ